MCDPAAALERVEVVYALLVNMCQDYPAHSPSPFDLAVARILLLGALDVLPDAEEVYAEWT